MPYCCQCGTQVEPADQFCPKCGARQEPILQGPPRPAQASGRFDPRTASILCYVPFVGWIAALVVLASHQFRENRTVRFHAFQGLYLFVAWLLVDWVFSPMAFFMHGHFPMAGLMKLAIILVWVFMMNKASRGETYSLPIIGELAERSLAER
jgi:uncharacterized membrane protein